MGDRGNGADDGGRTTRLPSTPRVVSGDPRKFSAYVLVPGHRTGKDRVFLGMLGYRPYSEEDAHALLTTYVSQARAKLARGEYEIDARDHHGQRYTIEIEIKGRFVLSGWILRPDGTLWLATPFTGFSR